MCVPVYAWAHLCVYIYMFKHMLACTQPTCGHLCIDTCVYMHAYIFACLCSCVNISSANINVVCAYVHLSVCQCMLICVCVYVSACIPLCVNAYICSCLCAHTSICTYMYVHTYMMHTHEPCVHLPVSLHVWAHSIYTHPFLCTCVYIDPWACVLICLGIFKYVYICVPVYTSACFPVCTHVHNSAYMKL